MSYHSTLFNEKEFRKYFTKKELEAMVLINIKGKPARKRGIEERDGVFIVYGSSFVARVAKK